MDLLVEPPPATDSSYGLSDRAPHGPQAHHGPPRPQREEAQLFEAIKSGAQGYLLKDLPSRDLFSYFEGVSRGEPALTPHLAGRLLQEFARPPRPAAAPHDPDALTKREREVLELMVQGVTTDRKLAKRLGLSENTVRFHVRNILDKLHQHNRAQVVGFALRHGLVAPGSSAE